MLVEQFLERSATESPGKTAIVAGARRVTYRELDTRANQLAHALRAAGTGRYDRVAVYLDNSIEAAIAVFAALKADGIFTVVNPTTKTGRLAYVLNDCRAAAIVTDRQRSERLAEVSPQLPELKVAFLAGVDEPLTDAMHVRAVPLRDTEAQLSTTPPRQNIDIDLAALIYTSGSTGGPKAVMMTHRSIASAATSITEYLENTPDDIILNVLPFSFDYGLYQLLMAAKVGATLVLDNQFMYPHTTLELMARERVTGLPLVPTMSAILLQIDLAKYNLPSLRYITSTGAALPVEHIKSLRAAFPSVRIFSMYGVTECKRVAYLPPEQADVRPGSVGRAIPNEEVYVVDENGNEVPPGVVGELVVRGSNVMSGYWERPDETARALRPGRFPGERVLYTGDLFRKDEEGYLYFVARKDDIIKTRGQKVSPREVEDVLLSFTGIAEAAVIGVSDPVLGQAVKAIVTPKAGARLTEQEVRRHCAQHLEDFMVPSFIEIRSEMPKSAHGKIAKSELASSAAERA